jgi:hypothetical protein
VLNVLCKKLSLKNTKVKQEYVWRISLDNMSCSTSDNDEIAVTDTPVMMTCKEELKIGVNTL